MIGLETIYVFKIQQLKEHKENPKTLDFIWIKKYKKDLHKRLERLENDYEKGLIEDKAYVIWKQMINEVI